MYCHMVSKNRLRVTVAYLIPFAMGQEMCSVAKRRMETCQNTRSIPLYNLAAEIHPSCGIAASDSRATHVRIGWEHPLFLSVAGVIVQIGGLGWEVMVVFHDIVRRVRTEREVTLGANDNSGGIANPFVGLWCELMAAEGVEWEGKAVGPIPVGMLKIVRIEKEHCEDLDLEHSRRHDELVKRVLDVAVLHNLSFPGPFSSQKWQKCDIA